ncbi:MAG TPA: hypothetical protein VLV76_21355 [Candidatus Acidoferrum sp.]|nr:hypothetical protein [Candidatus Acidoferrum sp.]
MRLLALFLLLVFAAPALAADWTVGPAPSDDPAMKAAVVMNEQGHALFLWSRQVDQRYQLFAELHLGRGEAFGEKMPTYRIDGGEPVDTDVVRQRGDALGALWGHVGGDTAFWLAWTSIQQVILPSDDFAHWLGGREIEFSYQAPDGTAKTTSFSLAGAAAAIRGATGFQTP